MKSKEAKMLHKEVDDVKKALKKHVKVSEVPEEWKKEMNMLKVHVKNQELIEKEFNDVEKLWENIEDS